MIFRRLAVYTWAVKRSRWACFVLGNKTGSSKLSLKQQHFPLACIPPEIRLVYLLRVDGCFYLAKIISFVPFLSVTLFKVINTLWQKLFLREVFKPSWGSAELYIFKNSLSSNSAASPLIPVNYMFSYAQEGWRGKSCPQSMPHFMHWGLGAFCCTLICF